MPPRQELLATDHLIVEALGRGPLTISTIAKQTGLQRKLIGQKVLALRRRGLVEPSATGSRGALSLTDEGRALIE